MNRPQAHPPEHFALHSERLGPLPLVNHFLERMGLPALLERYVPTPDRRSAVSHAQALGVLLRSILVEREPVYRQQEAVHSFAAGMFGIDAEQMRRLSDDRIGRAPDRLFDADRAALLTEVVVAVGQRFGVAFERLHNDSTSIALCGQYRAAGGRTLRARTAPAITFGFSKDHRPDLKQLLFILTVTAEGVPASFRCADGNTSDSVTHVQTWEALRAVAGRADFLYVADSKLCSYENMQHIDAAGGRFVTVMPRSRQEDARFRQWLQTHTPDWELVWERPNARHADGPRDCWYVYRPPLSSMRLGRGSNSTIGKMLDVWRSKRTAAALPQVAATLPPDIANAVAVHIAREVAASKKAMDQAVEVERAARQAAESQLDQLQARVEALVADREQLREERDQFAGRLKQVQEDIGSERNRLIGEAKAAEDRAHAAALQAAALDATLRSVTERMEAAEAREWATRKPHRS